MSLESLLIVPIAIGHLALFTAITNVVHAFGHSDRVMNPVKLLLLFSLSVIAVALGGEAWHGSIWTWSWPAFLYAMVCLAMGLIVFPLSTAYLHHRPRPSGIGEQSTLLDLIPPDGTDSLIGTGWHAQLLKLPGNQSLRLRKVECDLTLPGLPPALDGLSILHISDLHFAPSYDRRYFEAVADEAMSWGQSDLVLFTGDLVDHEDAVDWIVPILSRLRGKLGAFAILGNHDLDHDPARLRRLLEQAGFTDLEASWATVSARGKTIALGGTSYPWGHPLANSERPQADYRILLSHSPDLFYWAERAGFDLMFSGHNHGGQIRFPLVGAVFMPSVYSRRFDRGFFRKNGLTLHVSQGVGGKHPVRYGCLPEIGRLILRAAPSDRRVDGHDSTIRLHGHERGVRDELTR